MSGFDGKIRSLPSAFRGAHPRKITSATINAKNIFSNVKQAFASLSLVPSVA